MHSFFLYSYVFVFFFMATTTPELDTRKIFGSVRGVYETVCGGACVAARPWRRRWRVCVCVCFLCVCLLRVCVCVSVTARVFFLVVLTIDRAPLPYTEPVKASALLFDG